MVRRNQEPEGEVLGVGWDGLGWKEGSGGRGGRDPGKVHGGVGGNVIALQWWEE
jgi:hypothetical protein